ncbi:hypothetical protein PpBr36_08865 [Pyricularia pennisetigena]|uniref:hypothetical protein n=1 Tax=Pyricularia pennisetigena TaxID=1578925 RepID=UPI001153714E|nr:hypothetical protein PpBr36_08865 [Pyricularia pennisetigena]TLS24806.1 hypothetical protein PpBr36_08865 [Pyricularia pennisetigena]
MISKAETSIVGRQLGVADVRVQWVGRRFYSAIPRFSWLHGSLGPGAGSGCDSKTSGATSSVNALITELALLTLTPTAAPSAAARARLHCLQSVDDPGAIYLVSQ